MIDKTQAECIEFMQDLRAYLLFSMERGVSSEDMLMTVSHDLGGFLNGDRMFSPRSEGYAEVMKKNKKG